MSPIKLGNVCSTNSRVICEVSKVASSWVSLSNEGVDAPSFMVAIYSLSLCKYVSICFVAFPVQSIMTPVAKGSRVPV